MWCRLLWYFCNCLANVSKLNCLNT
uniref:Uncharacterized protein n=1 Tax=Anguilla anguilla TaxID=7936 RepID=A0A0E9SPD8_ANGAN